MTDKTKALIDLLAKVEAGEPYETMGHTQMCQKAFPNPEDFDGSREAYAKSAAQQAILVWRNGSLDAAKALHEAMLGDGFNYCIHSDSASVMTWAHTVIGQTFSARDKKPARAWLIAIIKALIAEEETHDK